MRNNVRRMALGAAAVTAMSLSTTAAFANNFWAGAEPHVIVATSEPHIYNVCNLLHQHGTEQQRAGLSVETETRTFIIAQGRCTHVEGSEIAVMSTDGSVPAHGTFHKVD